MIKNKLTLSFITYSEIGKLDSVGRIKKILDIVILIQYKNIFTKL